MIFEIARVGDSLVTSIGDAKGAGPAHCTEASRGPKKVSQAPLPKTNRF